MLTYTPTPVQEIEDEKLLEAGVRLLVKREDRNHPLVSGNKWWKLLYNLQEAQQLGKKTLLTFGGAFSNHIYATAAAAHELGIKSIGLIRGEATLPLNATLRFARQQGMQIEYVSREAYRRKADPEFEDDLCRKYGDVYILPEGGTNALAVRGCEAFAKILQEVPFDYVVLPAGTGGTMAGLIGGLDTSKRVVGVSVLKGDFLKEEVKQWLTGRNTPPWSILTDYHHGGYAKTTPALIDFIRTMENHHALPLDQVYTGKMMWAIMQEVERGFFERGTTILAIHTGGLQGRLQQL